MGECLGESFGVINLDLNPRASTFTYCVTLGKLYNSLCGSISLSAKGVEYIVVKSRYSYICKDLSMMSEMHYSFLKIREYIICAWLGL